MMLAEEVGAILKKRSETVAVAESCTGGALGDVITDVSGSSDYFLGGIISYGNQAKINLLGVNERVLREDGAVSEKVAIQMADGARNRLGSTYGIGITGIAGPTGATKNKPVGLVFIAVSSGHGSVCERNLFKGSRREVKDQAASEALRLFKSVLEKF